MSPSATVSSTSRRDFVILIAYMSYANFVRDMLMELCKSAIQNVC